MKSSKSGFTLLEMLLVIAIIAILAAIVIVAINPGRQLAQARNSERASELNAIYKATNQYYIDNLGWPTSTLPTSLTEICATDDEGTGHGVDCSGLLDLSALVPDYLSAIPANPSGGTDAQGAGYYLALEGISNLVLSAATSTEYDLALVAIGTTTEVGGEAAAEEPSTLLNDLLVYYPFEDNLNDESGNSNNLTNSGSAPSYIASDIAGGNCIDINYAAAPKLQSSSNVSFSGNTFTLSAWANLDTYSTSRSEKFLAQLSDSWGGSSGGVIFIDGNNQLIYGGRGAAALYSGGASSIGSFKHYLLTYNGSQVVLYVDNSAVFTQSQATALDSSTPLTIGWLIGESHYWDGCIDEVAVWDRVLTSDERSELYNGGSGVSLIQ